MADRQIGRTPPRRDARYWTTDLERPFCTIASMKGRFVAGGTEGVTSLAESHGVAKRVPAGSLLLSFKLTLGKVGITDRDVFPNEAIAWLRPRNDVLRDFLALALENVDWEPLGGRAVKGKTLNSESLDAVPLLIAPLAEQQRIIDLMDALSTAIDAAEQALRRLDGFTELARDVQVWDVDELVALGELCSVDGSLVSPIGPLSNLPHIGAERIESGTGELVGVVSAQEDGVTSGKYLCDHSHVVYSKIRPNLRKVALPTERGLCSADAYPLLPKAGVPRRYLQQLLLSSPFTDSAVSRSGRTKMPKINRSELLSIEVPRHTPERMAELSTLFDAVVATRQATVAKIEKLVSLRSSVLTALMSGEHEIPESYDELLEVV